MRFLPGLALLIAGASATEDKKTTTTAAPAKLKNSAIEADVGFTTSAAVTTCDEQQVVVNMLSVGTVATIGGVLRGGDVTADHLKDAKNPIYCDDSIKCEAKTASKYACLCRKQPAEAPKMGTAAAHKDLQWDKTKNTYLCKAADDAKKTDSSSDSSSSTTAAAASSSASAATTTAPSSSNSATNADCVQELQYSGCAADSTTGVFQRTRSHKGAATTAQSGTGRACPLDAQTVPCAPEEYADCVLNSNGVTAATGGCAKDTDDNNVCKQSFEFTLDSIVDTTAAPAGKCPEWLMSSGNPVVGKNINT